MDEIFNDSEQVIERCQECDNWIRRGATRIVKVGGREDQERWCIGCIEEVDQYTLDLVEPKEALPPPDVDI